MECGHLAVAGEQKINGEKMDKDEIRMQNKMGVVPVRKLLLTMGAPMMFSMFVQALYNVVDTLFVSHIANADGIVNAGDKAVSALALAFPVQMLITALCVGTGVGVNALLSKSLGEKNVEQANRVTGNSLLINVSYYIVILVSAIIFAEEFIRSQTSDPDIQMMGTEYLKIVTFFSFGTILYMCYEKLLQATGQTTAAMIGQLVGAVTNIILDPILIFGYFGLPALGVRGAAIATIAGQIFSFFVVLCLHIIKNKEITNSIEYIRPDPDILKKIYRIGGPAIIMQALTSFMTYGMNIILGGISPTAITAYGIYYKLQNFIFMPVYGLNNASIPIISFNVGAKQKERVKQTIENGLIIAMSIMLAGIGFIQIFAMPIVSCFALSDKAFELCVIALKIISAGFLFSGANIMLQGICQALGNGMYSLIISLMRMIVIVLPMAYIFSNFAYAEKLVWIAVPAAEFTAMVTAVLLTRRICAAHKIIFGKEDGKRDKKYKWFSGALD